MKISVKYNFSWKRFFSHPVSFTNQGRGQKTELMRLGMMFNTCHPDRLPFPELQTSAVYSGPSGLQVSLRIHTAVLPCYDIGSSWLMIQQTVPHLVLLTDIDT